MEQRSIQKKNKGRFYSVYYQRKVYMNINKGETQYICLKAWDDREMFQFF